MCFLFSFLNPAHELRVKEILAEEMPGAHLSISHEVTPQHREYERFSTTALNAYIGPKTSRYLESMGAALEQLAASTEFHLMASNGGTLTVDGAVQRPTQLLMSGPVAGIIGGIAVGRRGGTGQRDHARRGRDVGRHRRRPGRPAADEAPVRHQHRRLRRDGADGRPRHDRRRRRVDRPDRRRRSAARRAAQRGRRPRPRLLRPRRHRADRHRRAGGARTAAPAGAPGRQSRAERRARRARRSPASASSSAWTPTTRRSG